MMCVCAIYVRLRSPLQTGSGAVACQAVQPHNVNSACTDSHLLPVVACCRTARARCTDERVRLMSEAVEGHLAVKMCGLEVSGTGGAGRRHKASPQLGSGG